MKAEYESKRAVLELHKPVEFDSGFDAITLDIPETGITVKEWEITPLIPPVVSSPQS